MQPPLKLRNSKLCLVSSFTVIEYSSDYQRLWSECAYAQADLSLCWSHIPHCWKYHVATQMYRCYVQCIFTISKIVDLIFVYLADYQLYFIQLVYAFYQHPQTCHNRDLSQKILFGKMISLTVSLLLSHWYPGSGVVLDCIDLCTLTYSVIQ